MESTMNSPIEWFLLCVIWPWCIAPGHINVWIVAAASATWCTASAHAITTAIK